MPYDTVKRGDGWAVVKKLPNGKTKTMHTYKGDDARAKALAYLRALYSHSKDTK